MLTDFYGLAKLLVAGFVVYGPRQAFGGTSVRCVSLRSQRPTESRQDEFAGLLARPGLFASSRPVDAADFRAFVTRFASLVRCCFGTFYCASQCLDFTIRRVHLQAHLSIVAHSSVPKTALLYGESIAQHRVCVAIRQRDNSKVCNVDIKVTEPQTCHIERNAFNVRLL